jgi:hypothetical protein
MIHEFQHGASNTEGLRGDWSIAMSLMGTILVFLPIAYIGFTVLARQQARHLLMLMVLVCAGLLPPLRGAIPISLILWIQLICLMGANLIWFRKDELMKTWEARAAVALTWIAPCIVLGRVMFDEMFGFAAMLPLAVVLVLLGLNLTITYKNLPRSLCRTAGLIMMLMGWPCFITGLLSVHTLDSAYWLLATSLPICWFLLLYRPAQSKTHASVQGASGACATVFIYLLLYPGHDYALLCMLTGIGVAVAGFHQRSKAVFSIGLSGFLLGLAYFFHYGADLYRYNSWLSLALLGVLMILSASYLNRLEKPLFDLIRRICRPTQGWR